MPRTCQNCHGILAVGIKLKKNTISQTAFPILRTNWVLEKQESGTPFLKRPGPEGTVGYGADVKPTN